MTHHVVSYTLAANVITRVAQDDTGRAAALFQNRGAGDVSLGGPDVTAAAGILLSGGQTPPSSFADEATPAAWYAVSTAGTTLVVDEIY